MAAIATARAEASSGRAIAKVGMAGVVERVEAIAMTKRELATVLTALRHWQAALPEVVEGYEDIVTDGGRFKALSVDELDELCIELNCGEET
jgi:hypothetical protein